MPRYLAATLLAFLMLVAACGLVWPGDPWPGSAWPSGIQDNVCLGTDYSARDTCYWLINAFTDGDILSAEIDRCPAFPEQVGQTDVDWNAGVVVDEGDVPFGSPDGADSTYHEPPYQSSAGAIAVDDFDSDDMTTGGWWKPTGTLAYHMVRFGGGGAAEGRFHAWRKGAAPNSRELIFKMSGTESPPGPDYHQPPEDEWNFFAFQSDAGSGSGTLRIFTSLSGVAGTLLDCTGGGGACGVDAVGMALTDAFTFHMNPAGGAVFEGNAFELWFAAEALSEEEVCEICRCGFRGDNVSDRKAECNHCSMTEAARGLGPAEPWP